MACRRYLCDTCDTPHRILDSIWDCPGCGVETCEGCFDRYAHCKTCGKDRTDDDLRSAANKNGFDFRED